LCSFCLERESDPVQTIAVHHVSINVDDVAEALRFYVDALGLSPRDDRPDLGIDGAWLDAGGQQVHLIRAAAPPNVGQHFALLVADIDTSVGELRDRGISVTDPTPIGTGRQSFLQDPAGNVVELHEAPVG
jgi:glyoxylase I family protein